MPATSYFAVRSVQPYVVCLSAALVSRLFLDLKNVRQLAAFLRSLFFTRRLQVAVLS